MQPDTSLMVWMVRLQQTEALIHKRRQELAAHQQRRLGLQAMLEEAEEAQTGHAVQELADLRQQAEELTKRKVQLQQDIRAARGELASAQDTSRLASQREDLRSQLERLQAACAAEASVQQQYTSHVCEYMEGVGARAAQLTHKIDQVGERMHQLQQKEAKAGLEQQLSSLAQQQARLQAELHQLTGALTDSKQANVCARAKLDAEVNNTCTQVQAAQEQLVAAKRRAFELSRQSAVNEARLQQLRQESGRCGQQCAHLEALMAHAAASIDQLASSCDL